jgi:hypothetical protein
MDGPSEKKTRKVHLKKKTSDPSDFRRATYQINNNVKINIMCVCACMILGIH